nr:uncharacterized protein LOC115850230 [Globicephala melas]
MIRSFPSLGVPGPDGPPSQPSSSSRPDDLKTFKWLTNWTARRLLGNRVLALVPLSGRALAGGLPASSCAGAPHGLCVLAQRIVAAPPSLPVCAVVSAGRGSLDLACCGRAFRGLRGWAPSGPAGSQRERVVQGRVRAGRAEAGSGTRELEPRSPRPGPEWPSGRRRCSARPSAARGIASFRESRGPEGSLCRRPRAGSSVPVASGGAAEGPERGARRRSSPRTGASGAGGLSASVDGVGPPPLSQSCTLFQEQQKMNQPLCVNVWAPSLHPGSHRCDQ